MVFLRRTSRVASAVTLFLLVASCAFAQSQQRPEPRGSVSGAQQPPTPDPRGTDASPFIVKVQPTPKTNDETAEERSQKEQEASDRRLTRSLAIATAILAAMQLGAIGFQVYIARRQNTIIESQNTIMTGQRDAADTQSTYMRDGLTETRNSIAEATKSASAMDSIARSMAVNAKFVEESISVTKQMAATNLTAFQAGNRASMNVRPISMDGFDHLGHLLSNITNARVRITNVGAVNATFMRFYSQWLLTIALPVNNPAVQALDQDSEATVVPPGYFEDKPIDDFQLAADVYRLFNNNVGAAYAGHERLPNEDALYLFGYVKFSDTLGLRRKYFCWRHNPYLRSFAPVNHPQYDYEE